MEQLREPHLQDSGSKWIWNTAMAQKVLRNHKIFCCSGAPNPKPKTWEQKYFRQIVANSAPMAAELAAAFDRVEEAQAALRSAMGTSGYRVACEAVHAAERSSTMSAPGSKSRDSRA